MAENRFTVQQHCNIAKHTHSLNRQSTSDIRRLCQYFKFIPEYFEFYWSMFLGHKCMHIFHLLGHRNPPPSDNDGEPTHRKHHGGCHLNVQ